MFLQIKSPVSSGDESEIATKPFKKKKLYHQGEASWKQFHAEVVFTTLTYVIVCEF